MAYEKYIEGIRNTFDKLWSNLTKSTSIFVSTIFLIFTLGMAFGYFIAFLPTRHLWVLMIPPLLGVIAYYYRTFAIIIFILFILAFLI